MNWCSCIKYKEATPEGWGTQYVFEFVKLAVFQWLVTTIFQEPYEPVCVCVWIDI